MARRQVGGDGGRLSAAVWRGHAYDAVAQNRANNRTSVSETAQGRSVRLAIDMPIV